MGLIKMSETITLHVPITLGGVETKTLTMRRPKVRDQMNHHSDGRMTAEGTMAMYADLCGISPEEMYELDLLDYLEVGDVYDSFLEKPEDLKTPPPLES